MKRILPALLCLIALLTSCAKGGVPAASVSQDSGTTKPATTASVTTDPSPSVTTEPSPSVTTEPSPSVTTEPSPSITTEPSPSVTTEPSPSVTTEPITTEPQPPETTAPPTTEPAPVFGDVDLDNVDRDDRTVVYTAAKTALYDREGNKITEIGAGKALIALQTTDDYAVILYGDDLCLAVPDWLTDQVPSEAKAMQDALGGIYYPGGELLVAIDAGHQGSAMKEKEPLGPGSSELKAMLSIGTAGVSTRIAERELNLRVALLLRDELIARGYSVVMIRESHEVSLSNAQRAQIANAYEADAFVRIHANASNNPEARGAMTICQTVNNPYNGELFVESYALSACMLASYCDATGVKLNNVWMTDTMTGINWAEVPVTIVEMGYMSNVEEDVLMATDAFRKNAAVGMANGLDAFFALYTEN